MLVLHEEAFLVDSFAASQVYRDGDMPENDAET